MNAPRSTRIQQVLAYFQKQQEVAVTLTFEDLPEDAIFVLGVKTHPEMFIEALLKTSPHEAMCVTRRDRQGACLPAKDPKSWRWLGKSNRHFKPDVPVTRIC